MNLYIIPGGGETIEDPGYADIIAAAKKQGYRVKSINVQLKQADIGALLNEVVTIVKKDSPKETAVLGFSSGALIAYNVATKIPIQAGYFCSLAPLFGEDIPPVAEIYKRYFGEATIQQMREQEYGRSKAMHNYFFYGDCEGYKIPRRTRQLAETGESEIVVLPNTGHDLTERYVNAITSKL